MGAMEFRRVIHKGDRQIVGGLLERYQNLAPAHAGSVNDHSGFLQ